jgi:hypothetical protein
MMSKAKLPQNSLSSVTCARWVASLALGWVLLAAVVSDPVDLDMPNLTELALSVLLPQPTAGLSGYKFGVHTTYGAVVVPAPTTTLTPYFLERIDFLADDDFEPIVTLGARSELSAPLLFAALLAFLRAHGIT